MVVTVVAISTRCVDRRVGYAAVAIHDLAGKVKRQLSTASRIELGRQRDHEFTGDRGTLARLALLVCVSKRSPVRGPCGSIDRQDQI